MPIAFTCPQCGKTIKAPDSKAGKTAKCPACQTLLTIPMLESPEPEPPVPTEPAFPATSFDFTEPTTGFDPSAFQFDSTPAPVTPAVVKPAVSGKPAKAPPTKKNLPAEPVQFQLPDFEIQPEQFQFELSPPPVIEPKTPAGKATKTAAKPKPAPPPAPEPVIPAEPIIPPAFDQMESWDQNLNFESSPATSASDDTPAENEQPAAESGFPPIDELAEPAFPESIAAVPSDDVSTTTPMNAEPVAKKRVDKKKSGSVGEYLSFQKFLTPVVIQLIFWLNVATSTLFALALFVVGIIGLSQPHGLFIFLGNAFLAICTLCFGILGARIFCELVILAFRIYETLQNIQSTLESQRVSKDTPAEQTLPVGIEEFAASTPTELPETPVIQTAEQENQLPEVASTTAEVDDLNWDFQAEETQQS